MANSDTLLLWVIYLQFAFFLLPGIAWLVDRGIHRSHKPTMQARTTRPRGGHRSRLHTFRKARTRKVAKHAA